MGGNINGKLLQLSTFGESHGNAIGGILDGLPAGLKIDVKLIQDELNRRRPGQSAIVSSRNEEDKVEFLSGILDNYSLGTPIAFLVRNEDKRSGDYSHLTNAYRPSHADYTYDKKYGIRDVRGGGRSSARETVARVVAGAIAKQFLAFFGIKISAYVCGIGSVRLEKPYNKLNLDNIESSIVRCPDEYKSDLMTRLIEKTAKKGDTLGGEITCVIKNVPVGLGEPVFNKLSADLGHAILGINAVKGFEIGSGFEAAQMTGSAHNDAFILENDEIRTTTNFSGGIQGGISNGQDIYFRVAFKPIATIMKDQESVDNQGNKVSIAGKGRHDVCVVPRAVPIVEAMSALVIADHMLMNKVAKMENL
jgi:chorismate synthase